MPVSNFRIVAKSLDDARLNKQRVEAKQIHMVLRGETNAWRNHPAVTMWREYESALASYGHAMCLEWTRRGGNDHADLTGWFAARIMDGPIPVPTWVYSSELHASHRSNLIRKNEGHYAPQWFHAPRGMPYLWPVWDEATRTWRYRLSVSEAARSGWQLPSYLSYDPATRYITK